MSEEKSGSSMGSANDSGCGSDLLKKKNGQEVTKPVETLDKDESMEEPASDPTQKARKRTKGLQRKLQSQIEFYFSDSNLTKDRFLKQKIAEHKDGYVSVDLVSSFNKMKSLSTDKNIILQAIKRSSLVELSPDELWIRRATPLPSLSEQEVDSRTVYVENLPPKTNHDKLKTLFNHFGVVTYVSLPRYKNSSSVKGFAFIEFSSADGAKKAVEHFKPKEASVSVVPEAPPTESEKHPSNNEESAPLATEDSVFVESVKQLLPAVSSGTEKTKGDSESFQSDKEVPDACCKEEKKPVKRPREEEEEEQGEKNSEEAELSPNPKRKKEDPDTNEPEETLLSSNTQKKKTDSESNESEDVLSPSVKRKKTDPESNAEQSIPLTEKEKDGLTVLTRKRTHQDSESNDLNDSLSKAARLDSTWSELSTAEDGDDEESKKKKKTRTRRRRRDSVPQKLKNLNLRVISKSEWLEMKVMYKKMQKEHMKSVKAENSAAAKEPGLDKHSSGLVTNCLVKVMCTVEGEGCQTTIETLRDFCSKYGPVAYVDYEKGSETGYVRYGESGCTQRLVDAEDKLSGVKFEAVSEEEERGYYLKTKAARRQKFINKRNHRQTRGLDKVISRAIKRTEKPQKVSSQAIHIRFSDSDEED